jgi:hypothetical protein
MLLRRRMQIERELQIGSLTVSRSSKSLSSQGLIVDITRSRKSDLRITNCIRYPVTKEAALDL